MKWIIFLTIQIRWAWKKNTPWKSILHSRIRKLLLMGSVTITCKKTRKSIRFIFNDYFNCPIMFRLIWMLKRFFSMGHNRIWRCWLLTVCQCQVSRMKKCSSSHACSLQMTIQFSSFASLEIQMEIELSFGRWFTSSNLPSDINKNCRFSLISII